MEESLRLGLSFGPVPSRQQLSNSRNHKQYLRSGFGLGAVQDLDRLQAVKFGRIAHLSTGDNQGKNIVGPRCGFWDWSATASDLVPLLLSFPTALHETRSRQHANACAR